jgi:hypothetical protein
MSFSFYLPESNPSTTGSQIGGAITSSPLSGYLGELFPRIEAPPVNSSLSFVQYRKIFVKNEYNFGSANTRLWLDAEQHRGQIAVAVQTGVSDTIANALAVPSGISDWASPTNYSNGLEIGTLGSNSYTGVWVRQTLTDISEPDPYASLRLYIGGLLD